MKTSIRFFSRILAALVVALLMISGTGSPSAEAARKSGTSNRNAPAPVVADTVINGVVGPGALYRLIKPDNWNGGLVLFAHASVSPTAPVELPPDGATFAPLVTSRGYAFAYSSFSTNSGAVKDGSIRTHQLIEIFTTYFGPPTRVYITGKSLGGIIAIKLAEQYPTQFAGAMPVCAQAGGSQMQLDYAANVRALFDVFYPGVLPGDAITMDANTNVETQIRAPALAAMLLDMSGALKIAAINQTPVPFLTQGNLRTAIGNMLVNNANESIFGVNPEFQGRSTFDNRATQYTSATLPSEVLEYVNENVGRYGAVPSVLNYLEKYYNPTGKLQIPMVLLTTSHDPNAPAFHRTAYTERVAAAGDPDMLYQRVIGPRFGHCLISGPETAAAFDVLTLWVEQGIPPAP